MDAQIVEDQVGFDAVRKRSVLIKGKRTSISLEDRFWDSLKDMADREGGTIQRIVSEIDKARKGPNLSSAVRVAILDYNIKMRDDPRYYLTKSPTGRSRSMTPRVLSVVEA